MLFANRKKGFSYQTEPLGCHSTKALEGLELVDLNHSFTSLYLSDSTCRAEGGKSSFFPQQLSSSERPQGSRTWHRLTNTGDRNEGRGKREESLLGPGDCSGRQGWLMNTSRMCLNFSFCMSSGKGSSGEFAAFASEKQWRLNPRSIILEFHRATQNLMHKTQQFHYLPQNMEPAHQKVPAQTLPLFPWSTGWISWLLPSLRWKQSKSRDMGDTCNTQKSRIIPTYQRPALPKLVPAAATATRMQPLISCCAQLCSTAELTLWTCDTSTKSS